MTHTASEITDIFLASFLMARGASFLSYDRSNPKRPRFFFVKDDQLEYQVRLYYSGRATQIPAYELFDCYRHLRCLVSPKK